MNPFKHIARWFGNLFSASLAEEAAKPKPLFERGVVYPRDEVGEYVELTGVVLSVGEQEYADDEVAVVVKTDRGECTGWTNYPPKIGYTAVIHLYNWGGGWYPDDSIVSWQDQSGHGYNLSTKETD